VKIEAHPGIVPILKSQHLQLFECKHNDVRRSPWAIHSDINVYHPEPSVGTPLEHNGLKTFAALMAEPWSMFNRLSSFDGAPAPVCWKYRLPLVGVLRCRGAQ